MSNESLIKCNNPLNALIFTFFVLQQGMNDEAGAINALMPLIKDITNEDVLLELSGKICALGITVVCCRICAIFTADYYCVFLCR
jgi:hypothetical protein